MWGIKEEKKDRKSRSKEGELRQRRGRVTGEREGEAEGLNDDKKDDKHLKAGGLQEKNDVQFEAHKPQYILRICVGPLCSFSTGLGQILTTFTSAERGGGPVC